jgi:hypothetical protein
MRKGRRYEWSLGSSAMFVAATLMFVPVRAVAEVSTQAGGDPVGSATQTVGDTTQTTGDAVGDTTQAAGDAVGGATQTVGDTTQTTGDAVGDTTQAAGDAVGGATQTVGDTTQAAGDAVGGATQAAGDAVGGATQAAGDAVGGATQAAGDATQTTGDAIGGATQSASAAVDPGTTSTDAAAGGAPSERKVSATPHQSIDPGAITWRPTNLGSRRLATDADALTAQDGARGLDEQSDPCEENVGSVCLGLLYGMGGFQDGAAKVLGLLVTTGAAVIGLMIISLGLGITGSTLVAVSKRSAVAKSAE